MNDSSEKGRVTVRIDPDIEEILPIFFGNLREYIKTIGESLKKDDYETIRILGHSIKGAGGGYGFGLITDMGADIEKAADSLDQEAVRANTSQLEDYLDRVDVVFE